MNKDLIKNISKLLKVDSVEALTKALESESDTFEFPSLIIRTSEEDETFKTNLLDNAKKEQLKAGMEIQIKNLKKATGLEYDGKKPEDFIEKYKNQILEEAKIEPNKKISELETSNSNLRKQLTEKDTKISDLESSFAQRELKLKAQSYIPTLAESVGLSQSEAVGLFFNSHEVKDGQVYRNNELLKDKLEKPITLETAVANFVAERKWTEKQPSGRGGGAGGGTGGQGDKLTLNDYEEALKEKGLSPGSVEANALLQDMAKDNPEILQEI